MQEVSNAEVNRRSTLRAKFLQGTFACVLLVIGSALFFTGRDNWKRSLLEPTADAAYYYVYLPSALLDRDLDFSNQYKITKNWYRLPPTELGRPGNVFGIGPAVFQSPAFLIGHGVALATGARRDGFSQWETGFVLWTGIPFSIGAMLLAAKLASRRGSSPTASLVGAMSALLAGPVCYYALRQPGYSHPFGTFFVALLVERWDASFDAHGPRSLGVWLGLGAALGASALARPQLALWAVILLPALIDDLKRREKTAVTTIAVRWLAGGLVALAVFSPQLIAWKLLYGHWYLVPQGQGFMRWDEPAWIETLFSSRNGLFAWSPLYFPMLLSLACLRASRRRIALCLVLGLLLQAVANGAAWDWWGGGSFGGRRFDSAFVVFALGAASGLDIAFRWIKQGTLYASGWRNRVRLAIGLVTVIFACLVTVGQVRLMSRTSVVSARITGGESAATLLRAASDDVFGATSAWLSQLVTFPVRAVFAWRNDVSLAAYDRLVGVHILGETFPGLNSYPDKTHDVLSLEVGNELWFSGLRLVGPSNALMTEDHARIFVGLNRRGHIRLRVPIQSEGRVYLYWNGDEVAAMQVNGHTLVEARTKEFRRGVNWLEIQAPSGTMLSRPEIFAEP